MQINEKPGGRGMEKIRSMGNRKILENGKIPGHGNPHGFLVMEKPK